MARIIHFEGRKISVPDDATDDEIRSILNSPPAGSSTGSIPPPPPGFVLDTIPPPPPGFVLDQPGTVRPPSAQIAQPPAAATPVAPRAPADGSWANLFSLGSDTGRRLQVSSQGAGRGIADTLGLPVDLMTGGLNAGVAGVNWLTGSELPLIERPFLGSDYIADATAGIADLMGVETIPYEEMSTPERIGYNINRFGTQAVAGSGALARQAAVRAPEIAAGSTRSVADAFLQPYFNNPGRVAVGDLASGVGSGVAVTAAEELAPDNPLAQSLAVLLGGFGGSAAADLGQGAGRFVSDATRPLTFRSFDPNLPVDPITNLPVRAGDAEEAARMMQTLMRCSSLCATR